jgi:hypothetical protein
MFSSFRKPAANAKVTIRRARRSTYTEPLRNTSVEYTEQEIEDLKQYLGDFYRTIYRRRAECSKICQNNPRTVGHFYEVLVPRLITYADFWQRCFYRCDPDRVVKEWDRLDKVRKQQLDQKLQESMQTAQNLWTSTVKTTKLEPAAKAEPSSESETEDDHDPFNADTFMKERERQLSVS